VVWCSRVNFEVRIWRSDDILFTEATDRPAQLFDRAPDLLEGPLEFEDAGLALG